VEHAHRRGVLHRDLSARNILVDEGGCAKVLDFGLAALLHRRAGSAGVTVAGSVIGTLRTMSPEQLSGDLQRVDTRSDVFSIGVIAFELVCGRHPFVPAEAGLAETVRRMTETPGPGRSSLPREARGDLGAVLLKAVERDPGLRYQSAGALASDLRAALEGKPVAARRGGAAYRAWRLCRRHRWPALAVAAALAAGMTLAGNWAVSMRREAATRTLALDALEAMIARVISPMAWRVGTLEDRAELLAAIGPGVEAMAAGAPRDARVMRIRGRYLVAWGDAARALTRYDEAFESYVRAIGVYEEIWRAAPGDVDVGHALSLAVVKAGDGDYSLGRPGAGLERYERAMELDRRLARLAPDSAPVLSNLFWSCFRISALLPEESRRHDELRDEMGMIAARMMEVAPEDWRSLEALAHRGVVETNRNQRLSASERLAVIEQSFGAVSRLVASRPDDAGRLALLIEVGRAAVVHSLAAGEPERAWSYSERMGEAAERLRLSAGDERVRTMALPMAAMTRAEMALIAKDWARALALVNEAMPMLREREGRDGPEPLVMAALKRADEIRRESETALAGASR
jgi:tetratricopeptide (TPR) repeat protein